MLISAGVGVSDRVERAGAGWRVPPGNAGALAAAVSRLVDGRLVDSAGRAARALYEQSYTDDVASASLIEIYEAAASGKRPPSRPQ